MCENRHKKISLHNPPGAILTIGPLEDTEYEDRPAVAKGWGWFYLPNTVNMEVLGYVEGTPYPCINHLVLMTCEDEKVYGYDGEEELHLVASSLNQMWTEGIAHPPIESFYHGYPLKDVVSR